MTAGQTPPNPFVIVAEALNCPHAALTIDSAMYKDHGWDSFGHVSVIVALEKAYGIRIDDDDIKQYATMKAIQELYEQILRGEHQHGR